MEAIDQNIKQFYYMSSREWKAHAQLRQLVVENFVERFHVRPINEEEHVVAGAYLDGTQLSFTRGPTNNVPFRESFNGRHQMGSYNERNENLNQEWLAKTLADGQFQFHPTQLKSLQGMLRGLHVGFRLIEQTILCSQLFVTTKHNTCAA